MLNLGHLIASSARQLAATSLGLPPTETTPGYGELLREMVSSPLLQREFIIFTNLQQQGMPAELLREYVEDNLRQLQGHTLSQLRQAHAGLQRFAPGQEPTTLQKAIQTLICEHLAPVGQQRVSAYYESLRLITESLGQPPVGHATSVPATQDGFTLPQLLSGAVGPLAENLEKLDEAQLRLVLTLGGSDTAAKQELFREYYQRVGEQLKDYPDTPAYTRHQQMRYSASTVDEELVDLHDFLYEE